MKKYQVLSLMFLVLGVGAVVALAEDSTTSTTTSTSASAVTAPMMINIGPAGNAMLRGIIVSVGTDSLVVKSWGGEWTVNVPSTAQVLSPTKKLADFKKDDFVGVLGKISSDGDFIIDAKILRAWGHRNDSDKDGIPDNQDEDDDNDGVENTHDFKDRDHDNDGIADSVDTDDDNDGILDKDDTMPFDHDNDGIPDFRETRFGHDIRVLKGMMRDHHDGDDDDQDDNDDSASGSGDDN